MRKKNFKTSFDDLLGEGKNQKKDHKITKEIRATFIVNSDHLDKLKGISFWEKKMIKVVLDESLTQYLEQYEKDKGPIQLPN